jgi:adenylate cyclase class 2
MLEVEMKFPLSDFASLEQCLRRWGARPAEESREADTYFNAPDRDFARTDEAFRLRQVDAKNVATYKGPKRDAWTKTRLEVEVPLAEGAEAADAFFRLVTHLGYRRSGTVRKRRRLHRVEREGYEMHVALDEVEGLGSFAELEIIAPEDQLEQARGVLLRAAAELRLSQSERRSYLQLLLAKEGKPA